MKKSWGEQYFIVLQNLVALFMGLSKTPPKGITHYDKESKFIFSATNVREVYPADTVV